jgi:tetratricopeptide (TPR) repeat protein
MVQERANLNPVTISQALNLALQHHENGRLAEAEALYRQILGVQPHHAEAWHHLGVIALQVGRLGSAMEWIGRAVALSPNESAIHSNLGEAYRLSSRLDEAVASFQKALELAPHLAELHNNLGNALKQQGRLEEARDAYRRAVDCHPGFAVARFNFANVARERGRLEEAVTEYREAVRLSPAYVEAWINLGAALLELGQFSEAVAAYRQALEIAPHHAGLWNNLGGGLHRQGQWKEAMAAYEKAIELQPDYPPAYNNRALLLQAGGRYAEAVASCRRALELKPDYADAYINLGQALAAQNEHLDAEAAYRRALELLPDSPEALSNLAASLSMLGRFGEAEAACRAALARRLDFPDALNNLGTALAGQGQAEAAIEAYRRAITLLPDYSLARFNLALQLLLSGQYDAGWPLLEARWGAYRYAPRDFSPPRWDGQELSGQRVLLHAEQGFGDAIHCIRYAPLVAQRGGEVIIECQRPLVELFRSVPGVRTVVADGDSLPSFDLHVPMLSLPLVFQTNLATIPQEVPYLFADPSRRKIWRERLGVARPRLRVGLAWAGNPLNIPLRKRDISLQSLAPVLAMEEVEFYSLQRDRAAQQLREYAGASAIIDHTPAIQDFADTAALMMELDLIITVDTSVAHLAGALGRPVWTLLSFVADWRWARTGEQAPWYPTMRLFRQPAIGYWEPVVQRVAEELRNVLADCIRDTSGASVQAR